MDETELQHKMRSACFSTALAVTLTAVLACEPDVEGLDAAPGRDRAAQAAKVDTLTVHC